MNTIGDRFKDYEAVSQLHLPRRLPVIIRVDGRSFHGLKSELDSPFDLHLVNAMEQTALRMFEQMDGAKFGYVQSDEISIVLTNDDNVQTQPWFGNNLQKLVSISASLATGYFSRYFGKLPPSRDFAQFDARAFVVPEREAFNYFLWRQQDWTRNSVSMLAREHFSQKRLQKMSVDTVRKLLMNEAGIDWYSLPLQLQRGAAIFKKDGVATVDRTPPYFGNDKDYINRHIIKQVVPSDE